MNHRIKTILPICLAVELGIAVAFGQSTNILVANFDGSNYGAWKTTGSAFGDRPAHGTLPNQMTVDGFRGTGLVNSFNGGDGATGTLTSPPFKIERNFLQFLIGGGGWDGKTCLNLLVDAKVVRTATGPNTNPGGSERLQPGQWNVADLLGKEVVLQIVDDATDGWGHINVDDIVQSDVRSGAEIVLRDVTREIRIEKSFLNFPVKNGAPMRHVSVWVDGHEERDFDIELADGQPDWWAFLDAAPFRGKNVTVKVNRLADNSTGLSAIDQSDEIKNHAEVYHETLRPQFHFTSQRGWLNDPNGLVFFAGEYHLFYQHNPYGWNAANMHWGHAVSTDLVHWRELPIALYPEGHGDDIWSGSAVVDWNNTAGFQTGSEPALVAMFTVSGKQFTQKIVFSNDRGRTWTPYQNNPVLKHIIGGNRDPKVVWFAPQKKWVMALYLDRSDYALFDSPDLKSWKKICDINLPGDSECPNFFQVPLNGDTNQMRWVFFGASGVYLVGKFDGQTFTPETKPQRLHNGNCWYASQVFSDIPANEGRCILIPWGRLPDGDIFRGATFNQMMGLPVELSLRSSNSGKSLTVRPVRELKLLRQTTHEIKSQKLGAAENPLAGVEGELLEIESEISVASAKRITFDLRGVPVVYDVAAQKISCMGNETKLVPKDGKISLHAFVDRASVDIFSGDGTVYLPMAKRLSPEDRSLKLFSEGGDAEIISLKIHELKSAWPIAK